MTLDELKQHARRSMLTLGIVLRPNIVSDGPLEFAYAAHLDGSPTPAAFNLRSGCDGIRNGDDPDQTHYLDPLILTNARLKSVLSAPPTFDVDYIYLLSIVVHEIIHYFQWEDDPYRKAYIQFKPDQNNYLEYLSQRCEFEAHAGQAFFFLTQTNDPVVDEIMQNESRDHIWRKLIDQFFLRTNRARIFHVVPD